MKIDNISFSMKVNIGNFGESISIMQTASVPEGESNEAERDQIYKDLVEDCVLKMKKTVSLLKREKETILFQNLFNNKQEINVSCNQQQEVKSPVVPLTQGFPSIQQFQEVPTVETVPSDGTGTHNNNYGIPPVDLNFKVDIPSV